MASSWLDINAQTTRTTDLLLDNTSNASGYYGPAFSGYNNLRFDINSNQTGTVDLGTRKLIYTNVNLWSINNGSYQINSSSGGEWFWVSNAKLIVAGGVGEDHFIFNQQDSTIIITDFNYKEDRIHYSVNSLVTNKELLQIQDNLKIIHAGSGSDARTQITIYDLQSTKFNQLIIPGYYELDGLDFPSKDKGVSIYLKPTSKLTIGDVEMITNSIGTPTNLQNRSPAGYASAMLPTGTQNKAYILSTSTLLQGFSDPDGDVLSVINLTTPNGSVIYNNDDTWTITPTTNYLGFVTLSYNVTDNKGGTINAGQGFGLNPAQNHSPSGAVSIVGNFVVGQTLQASVDKIQDQDGIGVIQYQWLRDGAFVSNQTQSSYTLTSEDLNKKISVLVRYTDGLGNLERINPPTPTTLVQTANKSPEGSATATLLSGLTNTPYLLDAATLLNGFSDPDGDTLTVKNLNATHGKLTNNNNGTWTLTPDSDYKGTLNLTYLVVDGKGGNIAGTQSVTLLDNSKFSVSSPSMTEGNLGAVDLKFTVSLDRAVSSDVTIDYKTEEGSASADVDYLTKTGTLKIPAGNLSTDVAVAVIGDKFSEANETLKLTLSNPKGITFGDNKLSISGIGTILDDDLPTASLPETKVVYAPQTAAKRADVTITLSAPLKIDSTITYHTQSGSALEKQDFESINSSLLLPAGANSGVISIPIFANTADEKEETFKLIIDKIEGGATLANGVSNLTISTLNLPILSVQNAQISEGDSGNKNLTFNVTLSQISDQPVHFTVKTVDKTATAGLDYQAIATEKEISAGAQSLIISVPVLGDKVAEENERFDLVLNGVTGAVLDNGDSTCSATGTILDDDKPVIRIEDVHVIEGNTGIHDAKIKVTLSTPAATPVTLHYKSTDGTAKAGEDFIAAEGDLTVPKGSSEGFIPVSIQGDTTAESAQSFHLVLSNPVNAQFIGLVASIQNTVTIDSDDGDNLPTVTVSKNLAIDEGDSGLTDFPLTLTLSSPATDTLTIQYQTIGVDAKADSDFISDTRTVTFLAGDVSQTIHLSVYGDTEPESDEDFTLSFTDPQGMRFESGLPTQDVTLLIRDDDSEPPQTLEGTARNDVLDATEKSGTGDDTLDGKQGADTMIGGDGNDTYYVDNVKDVIIEGDQSQSNAGDEDVVHSTASAYTLPTNVEYLIIDGKSKGNATGNGLDNKLTGNMAVNVLSGLAGNDTLDGGSGNDMLTGGDGADTFIFSGGIKGNKNIDAIKDFVHGQDKIYLSADIFSKLASAVKFVNGGEPISLSKLDSHYLVSNVKVKAVDASSYLLYDTKTGVLSYDEDGNGKLAASSFVTLTGKPTLTLDDFWMS